MISPNTNLKSTLDTLVTRGFQVLPRCFAWGTNDLEIDYVSSTALGNIARA